MKFLNHWETVAALCLLSMDTTYANNVQPELQRNPAPSIIGTTSLICGEKYGGFRCYETGQTFAVILSSQQTGCCPQHTASRVLRRDCSFGVPPPLHLSEAHRQG